MPLGTRRLLTIGEFSRLSRFSVRMLRHYDEHGVLHPTSVDAWTGHRSYAPELLGTARRLRELRDVGLGVADLAACAAVLDDAAALRDVLDRQRARLLDDASAVAGRLRGVDRLIEMLEEPAMATEITHRTIPAHTVASVRGTIPSYDQEGQLWQRLMSGLWGTGAVPADGARAVAVFHDETYVEHDADVEVQLDVAAPFESAGEIRCVTVPEVEAAVGVLRGGYEGVGAVMTDLGGWIAERGYRVAGPMFNTYLVGPEMTPDPSAWVTEVSVPVEASA